MASFMDRSTRPHHVRKAQKAASGASHSGTSGMKRLPQEGTAKKSMATAMVMTSTRREARM